MPVGDPLAALLAGTYIDPDTGEHLAAESRAVVIEDSLDGTEAELVAALDAGTRVGVISDVDTHAALGARVERALASRFTVQSLVLPAHPHADAATVARLDGALAADCDLVIAVGSGTLNDLAKYVAHARGIPQAVFATAPSMNGYTSVSASITIDGLKRSFRTRTPLGVFFDLRVLAAAPHRLLRAGLGDSISRPTAQADWLLSHLLLGRPYRATPFALLADDEPRLLADPRALVEGDLASVRALVRTLVLSGFGMTISGGSYPASQGEHLLAHYVELVAAELPHAYHGEQIGVCTLAMAALQDRILKSDTPPRLAASTIDRATLVDRYGAAGEACWSELAPKLLDEAGAAALNDKLAREWDAIRARILAISIHAVQLRAALEAAGAPTTPAELGWPDGLLERAIRHARELRDRYTFLDLAADAATA